MSYLSKFNELSFMKRYFVKYFNEFIELIIIDSPGKKQSFRCFLTMTFVM